MAKAGITVRFDGPFFTGDPAKKIDENRRQLMADIAQWGEARVKERLTGAGSGRTRNAYRGRVVSLSGKTWHQTAVISPNTTGLSSTEARSIMAAAHELEYGHAPGRHRHDPLGRGRGRHAISRTKAELTRWRRNMAEILKGLS